MKTCFLFAFLALALVLRSAAAPAPPTATPVPVPLELTLLRDEYAAALAPFAEKLNAAIKARGQKYGADLQVMEAQVTGAGQVEALALIRDERDAYAAGRGTCGFDEASTQIPSAVRDLRRIYERDVAKLRADAAVPARPVVERHLQKLGDLERTFVASRSADGVLAMQQERRNLQGIAVDPLYGGDDAVVGEWLGPKGKDKATFRPDGSYKSGKQGRWTWVDRARRKIHVDLQPSWAKDIDLTITADGWGLLGKDAGGGVHQLTRQK